MDKNYWHNYYRRRHEEAKLAYAAFIPYYPLSLEDLPDEQWKDIEGYNGDYQVSTYGRVKSFKWTKPRIIKPYLGNEYLQVSLSLGNKAKKRSIHILVAKAFIPNPLNKPEVNHIVGCKFNCHVDNLEWATDLENKQHAVRAAKLTNKQIIYIRDNPDNLTQDELAEMFGVKQNTISLIQLGKSYPNAGGTIREKKKPGYASKITEEFKQQIRADWATGLFSQRELARKSGYSHTTIRKIICEG